MKRANNDTSVYKERRKYMENSQEFLISDLQTLLNMH